MSTRAEHPTGSARTDSIPDDVIDPQKSYVERHRIKDVYETVCKRLVMTQPRAHDVTQQMVHELSCIRNARHHSTSPAVVFVLFSAEAIGTYAEKVTERVCRDLGFGFLNWTVALDAIASNPATTQPPGSGSLRVSRAAELLHQQLICETKNVVCVVNYATSIAHVHQFESSVFHPRAVLYLVVDESVEWWKTHPGSQVCSNASEALRHICRTVRPVAEYFRVRQLVGEEPTCLRYEEVPVKFTKWNAEAEQVVYDLMKAKLSVALEEK